MCFNISVLSTCFYVRVCFNAGGPGGRGGRRNYRVPPHEAGGTSGRGGGPSNQQGSTYRYESDFDFESANAQFNRQVLEEEFKRMRVSRGKGSEDGGGGSGVTEEPLEVEEEVEEDGEVVEEEEQEEEAGYDSSKSFFDNISCENPANTGRGR